jgi:lipid-binding SYLF domain-containing protein
MRTILTALFMVGVLVAAPVVFAAEEKKESKAGKRAEIDKVAKEALDEVLAKSKNASELYKKAHGYGVFDNLRITFILTGGGGSGVAVNKATGERTYMKMGTGGVGLGIGAQKYQVVLLFESKEVFTKFIEKGWKAESSASAAAGTKGANVGTTFVNGIAVYQITESGLMASADISGTKYSVDKKLNSQ